MLEQTLGFLRSGLQREKYIDPKYQKQIAEWDQKQNLEKSKRIAEAMAEAQKGQLVKGLAHSLGIAQDIREEIKAGDTSSFPYLLGLAILVDVVDFVPVIGTIVQVVAWPILFWGTFMQGRVKYKLGIKMSFYVLNLIEIVPGLSWLPLETFSILMLWRTTAKMRREKEAEEGENNQLIDGWERKLKQHDQMEQKLKGEIESIEKTIARGIKNQPQIDKQAA